MQPNDLMQYLIIAGNGLCAVIDPVYPTSEEDRQHALEAWEMVVKLVHESVQRPRTVWVKRSTEDRRAE